MQHDDLERILLNRAAPPAPRRDLPERIIGAALQSMPQNLRPQNLWAEFLSMFAMPHPSVAVAAGIILGVMAGLQAADGLFVLQQDWSSFLEINEGGWL
ncbi:MAG: hypothetical protein WC989_05080 [Micavibrio sp.]